MQSKKIITILSITAAHCLTDEKGQKNSEELYQVAVGKYYRKIDSPEDNEAQFSEVNFCNNLMHFN